MALSGTYTFTRTAGQIVSGALRKLGLLADGEEASADQMADGLDDLNLLVKSWPAKGIDLWRYEDLTVFVDTTSQSYSVGATGDKASFNAFKTELAVAASSGASTITVDSDANITNGDVIGIELSDGTLQWTTVNGVPASDVVTLTATLTGAASVDGHVYNYTSIAQRPMRLYDGRVKLDNDSEIELFQLSREGYKSLTTKETSGVPTQFYYNPLLDNGKLFVWPVSESVKYRLLFSAQRQLQDLTTTTDNLDFPQEWLRALTFNLAVDMAFDYSIIDTNSNLFTALKQHATELLEEVENFDIENASVFMSPNEDC